MNDSEHVYAPMRPLLPSFVVSCIAVACAPPASDVCEAASSASVLEPEPVGWRPPSGPCRIDPPSPSRLVLTTTDHSTGALTTVNPSDGQVRPDVGESQTDSIPVARGESIAVLHRLNDFIEFFEPTEAFGLRSVAQHRVGEGRGANPQALVVGPGGLAFVTLLAEPWVEILDPAAPPGEGLVDRIDISAFADPDGNPDAGVAVACGDTMYAAIGRLGPDFQRVDFDGLVAIDMNERVPLMPDRGPLRVRGRFIRQLRRDPADPDGTTLLALTTGIERIDLKTQEVTWAVSEDAFASAGIDHFYLPQAFALTEDGTMAYVAAYGSEQEDVTCACDFNACFDQVRLYRVGLDDAEPRIPEPFAGGFLSIGQTLERVGDRLWYGSTRPDAPGLWVFDTTTDPPTMLEGPLFTGLPPYAMVATE